MKKKSYFVKARPQSEGNYNLFTTMISNSNNTRYSKEAYKESHKMQQLNSVNTTYTKASLTVSHNNHESMMSTMELIAQWFLNKSSMSNKKLQKICYYAYSWYIVFFNDIECVNEKNKNDINVLCPERFQAWIHGPVLPQLYYKYKKYGWQQIPKSSALPNLTVQMEDLLQQVWEAYGKLSADDLEELSHQEAPWQKARHGIQNGKACSNEILPYDILMYYSSLG